jgi:hypothetical protein
MRAITVAAGCAVPSRGKTVITNAVLVFGVDPINFVCANPALAKR